MKNSESNVKSEFINDVTNFVEMMKDKYNVESKPGEHIHLPSLILLAGDPAADSNAIIAKTVVSGDSCTLNGILKGVLSNRDELSDLFINSVEDYKNENNEINSNLSDILSKIFGDKFKTEKPASQPEAKKADAAGEKDLSFNDDFANTIQAFSERWDLANTSKGHEKAIFAFAFESEPKGINNSGLFSGTIELAAEGLEFIASKKSEPVAKTIETVAREIALNKLKKHFSGRF